MLNRKLRTLLTAVFTIVLDVRASPSSRIELNTRQASLPPGWSVLGCYTFVDPLVIRFSLTNPSHYRDSTSARTLKTAAFSSVDDMTIESCLSFCTPAGYNFAGVEFARVSLSTLVLYSSQNSPEDRNAVCSFPSSWYLAKTNIPLVITNRLRQHHRGTRCSGHGRL